MSMKIGELARAAGVDVQTVRWYEKEGLMEAPARTASGYRSYGPAHLERLQFVRHCRSLDIPLADVKRLLALARDPRADCGAVDAMLHAHLQRVRAKLAALRTLESQLSRLGQDCSAGHRVADCHVLKELIRAARGEACACHAPDANG